MLLRHLGRILFLIQPLPDLQLTDFEDNRKHDQMC